MRLELIIIHQAGHLGFLRSETQNWTRNDDRNHDTLNNDRNHGQAIDLAATDAILALSVSLHSPCDHNSVQGWLAQSESQQYVSFA